MKRLKNILTEGILDDIESTLAKSDYEIDKMQIDEFIRKNYKQTSSKYRISKKKNKDGKYELSSTGAIWINSLATELVNDLFVWKKVKSFYACNNDNIKNLIGAPREVKNLYCHYSYNLESLEGCPEKIDGEVNLRFTSIKSLVGLPEKVGRLQCDHCDNLVNLNGCPQIVDSDISDLNGDCLFNECKNLRTLDGGPTYVKGRFDVDDCSNLISLKGSPKECFHYWCANCTSLTSFDGAPEKINGSFVGSRCSNVKYLDVHYMEVERNFSCEGCTNLISFRGAPKVIKEAFLADGCRRVRNLVGLPNVIGKELYLVKTGITSLEGCPKKVGEFFDIHFAGRQFEKEEISAVCSVPNIAV
jgi:hypothetical protein